MFFRKKRDEPADKTCLVCGQREGVAKINGGYVCRYCVPVNASFDNPSADEVQSLHVADAELLERIAAFTETVAFADLRFDDTHRLFFKGPWPSFCIPVLAYSEIAGYRIVVDDTPLAFNSVNGQRALFKVTTDEYIKKASKDIDKISLELDSARPNVRFLPYVIRGPSQRVEDSKEDCLRFAIAVSRKLDRIIEENISGVNSSSENNQSD
ncbi:MAG: hypothetical protein Q4Q58_00645 [Thermoplasmata archaeon]|nr:hypothetical protein [Thermoplasmata archaeon]